MSTLVYTEHENKMVDHRKYRLRQKLPQIQVVLVSNGYVATIQMPISIVDVQHRVVNRSRSDVSPVCMTH